jgi:Dolichyl-phosphate-mannose-protein mannosyltransferase
MKRFILHTSYFLSENTLRMDPSNLLRLSYWLDPALDQIPASPRVWLVVVLGLMGCALALAFRHKLGKSMAMPLALAGLLAAGVALGRLLAWPIPGLRLGWLIAFAIAAIPITLHQLRWAWRNSVVESCLRTASFSPLLIGEGPGVRSAWPLPFTLFWLSLHLFGLLIVTTGTNRWPWWSAVALLGFVLLPQLLRPHGLRKPYYALAPLLIVYLTLVIRVAIGLIHFALAGKYLVPEPFSTLFNPTLVLLVMVGYSVAIGYWLLAIDQGRSDIWFVKAGSLVLVALTLVWALYTALTLHTHGVSGSDPYAYTQMGVDLATRGTVFHPFPLVRLTYDLNIPTEPVVHIGYKLPQDVTRTATTVWPPGYAVFTGLAFLMGGETGVYMLAPLLSVLSLLVLAWLARSSFVIRHSSFAIAALALFFTATSYQQVEWQLIPMADIGAQLFSLLALALALTSSHKPGFLKKPGLWLLPAVAGLCIGIAFGVRYTQVLIAPAIALALILADKQNALKRILVCILFAALAAAPTLAYHAFAFGSPFATGSDELKHFSLTLLPTTLKTILTQLLWYREFGLLSPFIIIGAIALWQRHRQAALVLATYVIPIFAFHLLYSYLRQRDLLSIFPILYLLAAFGIVHLIKSLLNRAKRSPHLPLSSSPFLLIPVLLLVSALTLQRSIETMILPITKGYGAFGYLVREQRASFAQLAELTPPNAVIASSLNSGAIDLHAHRLAFRPAGWTSEQLLKFVRALHAENTPVFLLDDGKELADSLQTLRATFRVEAIAQLDVPFYFPNSGGSENRRVALYRISPPP